jgi:hypothetical protein
MDLWIYLTTPTSDFGGAEWVIFGAESGAVLAGIYLAFLRRDSHPIRGGALRRLGLALVVLGGLGVIFGVLRLAAVEPFTMPVWVYGVGLIEIALAVYALSYRWVRYPAQLAEFEQATRNASGRRGGTRPQPVLLTNRNGAGSVASFSEPRPVATSGRRGARRDRKRRGR